MFMIARLEVDREINAGKALRTILTATRPTPLEAGTLARGDAVITATLALVAARDTTPRQVDQATDTVVPAFKNGLEEREQSLRDSVVPLGDAQRQTLGYIRLLLTRLFPKGTDYIRLTMDLQWGHLDELRSRMGEPEVSTAIDALGLRSEADHVLAHVDRYERVLGQDTGPAGRATALASQAWYEAFRLFAAQVMVDYAAQPEMQRELLGPYEAQLTQQRAVAKARKSRAAAEAEEGPPSEAGGAAPPAG